MAGRSYMTVSDAAERYPLTEAAFRSLIFRAPLNGLQPAVIRLGRRVLIDVERFEQ